MRKLPVFVPLIAALALATSARAHEGKPDVMGTVTAIAERRIEVKTPEGKIVSAHLTMNTKYTEGFTPVTRSDVKVGMRAVLHCEATGDELTVFEVRLPSENARDQPHGAEPHRHPADSMVMDHQGSAQAHDDHPMAMPAGPLGLSESRMASGTAWQPDATPMYAVHFARGAWAIMAHWNLFAGYDHQGSDRGDSKWILPGWGMLMEKRSIGGGELELRQMLSIDPAGVGSKGYPLLLQTGESFKGAPLHDRQHPHDLFMELAVLYTRPISKALAIQVYAAPVGEPALGPVAFPHRLSAYSDPLAPLGHHWQDSTHISFGVFTAALMTRTLKLEGSWFNGREPDEHRSNFDFRRLDSYSGRVSFNPSENWSLQTSYGYLASPESLEPDQSVRRLTASASYTKALGSSGTLAAMAVFGRNDPSGGRATSSVLLEANYDTGARSVFFGRAESLKKTGRDLVLSPALDEDVFSVTSLVAGYVFQVASTQRFVMGIGARASVNLIASGLEPFYGTRKPAGYAVFLQFHPSKMKMPSMKDMSSNQTGP